MAWVVVLALGCAHRGDGGYGRTMAAGRAAHAQGDLYRAALSYREACRIRPTDSKTCRLAEDTAREAAAGAVIRAREACGKGDVDGCLAALAPARALFPNDPVALAVADDAGRRHAAACRADEMPTPERALAAMRCLEGRRAAIATAGFERRLAEAGVAASARFVAVADRRELRERPGAAYALWSAADCFDPQPEYARAAATARADLVAAAGVPVRVDVAMADGHPVPVSLASPCAAAVAPLEGAARCDAAAAFGVSVELALDRPDHFVSEQTRAVQYQRGTDVTENPAYRAAADRLYMAERAFQEIEQDARDRRARCEAAEQAHYRANSCSDCPERGEKERVCAEWQAIRATFERRASDLDDARASLRDTPEVIETPIYDTFEYAERAHRWEARYTARVVFGGAAVDHGESGTLVWEDVEHVGFAPAGLAEDPRRDPAPGYFESALAARVEARVRAALVADLGARAAARRSDCAGATPVWNAVWLECWAEAALWGEETLAAERLLAPVECL